MKICFSADWHVSNFGEDRRGPVTERGAACLRVVERLYSVPNIDQHVGLGDIFDTDKPSPGLTAALMRRITLPTMLLVGNHDQTSAEDSHNALAPMRKVARIVERQETFTFDDTDIALLGFRYRTNIVETIRSIQWSKGSRHRIIGIHLGIGDGNTPLHLQGSAGSIGVQQLADLCNEVNATHVFSGDWHNPSDWEVDGVRVCQVGGMIPQRYGDAHTLHGRIAIFDTDTGEISYKALAGPRFITVEGEPPWNIPDVPEADPLHVRYLTDARNHERAAIEAEQMGVPFKVKSPKAARDMASTEVDLDVEVPPPDVVALKMAHEKGGERLVNLMQRVFVEVKR